ncbi:MAG: ABC transporter substrate-binding protein [Thermoflexales bacterium]|nr:ABC transporter substrate-binding protein [Thermoflexales bacterium]
MTRSKRTMWLAALTCSLVLVLLGVISACGPTAPQVIEVTKEVIKEVEKEVKVEVTKEVVKEVVKEVTPIPPSKYSEAPQLAEQVKTGKLPPVEDRLPKNPLVVLPVKSVGQYGGTWHRGWSGIKDYHCFGRLNYEPMLRWPRDPKDPVQPGLAEKWEWADGGKTLTLYLREGLKWSDGAPFTVDDIIFWWEDIENDPKITSAPHAEWVVKGEKMTLEKVNDLTIKLKFVAPNGLAETVGLAFHGNQWPLGFERFGFFAPKHYLEQFHPKHNTSATYEIFEEKAMDYNTERPVMTPWQITDWKTGADHMLATRNPYYWKVDVEGNQLPYIDELYFYLVENTPAINSLALAGKIDMQARSIALAQYQVYQQNAEANNYHMLLWVNANASHMTFFPNQSYKDPQYRELLQNAKFRQALSQALDRDLMNQVAWLGQAEPRTITVVRDSALFQPDIEKLYAEQDLAQVKALLDEIGLKVGAGGMRTFADGTRIQLVIETMETGGPMLDVINLAAEAWTAAGVDTKVESMSRDVYWPRACGNEVMISTWSTDRGLVPMVDPIYQLPFDERSWMAPAFGIWYKTGGKEGEAPSAEMKELLDLYDQYRLTVDPDEQVKIGKQIVRLSTERLNAIGTCGQSPQPVVVKNYFYNVQEDFTTDWIVMAPGTQDPSHYWIDVAKVK